MWDEYGQFYYDPISGFQIFTLYGGADIHPDQYSHFIADSQDGPIPSTLRAIMYAMSNFIVYYNSYYGGPYGGGPNFVFRINDISLPDGGRFDIGWTIDRNVPIYDDNWIVIGYDIIPDSTNYIVDGYGVTREVIYRAKDVYPNIADRKFWIDPHERHRRGHNIDISYYSAYVGYNTAANTDMKIVPDDLWYKSFDNYLKQYSHEIYQEGDHMHIRPIASLRYGVYAY